MDDVELPTVSRVAEALSASSQTIRNWIRPEQLRGIRWIGRPTCRCNASGSTPYNAVPSWGE
ncbi:MAG TPA: hypothetical protein VKT31_12675 [Solirubrobacteraceae bacterium]|nr:hypothetical protein [Solirubrobacteraceae bacterium]